MESELSLSCTRVLDNLVLNAAKKSYRHFLLLLSRNGIPAQHANYLKLELVLLERQGPRANELL
jgi:hypothetical protein